MSPSFIFDPPSDEEIELSEHDSDESDSEQSQPESQSGEDSDPDSDSESEHRRKEPRVSKKKTQSPWDFTEYSESVAEEHARRSTTSVDDKISAVRQRSAPVVALPDNDGDSSSDSEADKRVIISAIIASNNLVYLV